MPSSGTELAGSVAPESGGRLGRPYLILALVLLAVVELVLLAAWQRNGYWEFSDGVYAVSAREFLHGLVPYRDFAAAQPPPVYLVGALSLAVYDGAASLHVGLALFDLATAVLVGVCVWRLDGRFLLAVAAGAISPLLPISLHEHAQLVPETLAAPLLLAGALWSARPGRSMAAGIVLALAVWCKLAFVVPAVAIALVSSAARRTTAVLIAACVVLAGVSVVVFGGGVWREAVQAQFEVGRTSIHQAAGLLAQVVWNEIPLLIAAAAFVYHAWVDRDQLRDPELVKTVTAAALGGLALALTVIKRGSYINVMVVAEPPLLVLAVCGAAWAWRHRASWRPIVAAVAVLLAVQTLSLLTNPGDPWAAKRPFAQSGLNWSAGPAAVQKAVAAARRCPGKVAYSGAPYFAFLAGRPMPGNQPDLFMIDNAPIDARFAHQVARDQPRCP